MVVVFSKKNAEKAFSKLLNPGESISSIIMTGGFSQKIVGTTSSNRLVIAPCGFFSSTPGVPEVNMQISDIKSIDFLLTKSYSYIILDCGEKKYNLRLGNSLSFDVAEEGSKMYNIITEVNPNASPDYLEGETTELMFKIQDGVLKLTRKAIIIIKPEENFSKINVSAKIPISDLRYIDSYPGKGIGDKYHLILKTDDFTENITIGGFFGNIADYLPQKEKDTDTVADIVFTELLRRNYKARPPYMEFDEMPVITMRVAHTYVGSIGSGSILRMTNKRIMELKPVNNELVVDYSYGIEEITRTLLTTTQEGNSESYKLEVFTKSKTYTYHAPATYLKGYEAFKLIGKTAAELHNKI